jgi:hypothetical protein
MYYRKLSLWLLLLTSLSFLLVGCNAANPSWSVVWQPTVQSAHESNPPELAYDACAYVQRPDGTIVHPIANTWLVTGTQPDFGLAVSQLDPADQFIAISVLSIDSGANWWTITGNSTVARPTAESGVPAAQEYSNAWTLPAGRYNTAIRQIPDTPPGGSVQIWFSNTGQILVLAHIYTAIQHPSTPVTAVNVHGYPGWLTTQGGFTRIALSLNDDLGTLFFASTTSPQQSQSLLAQATTNLNNILPS